MSDNMWNIFVLLLELNTIIVFLSGFIYFALIIRAKSGQGIPYSKLLQFFYILIVLTIVFPFLKIEHAQNFLFQPLITRNTIQAIDLQARQEVMPIFNSESIYPIEDNSLNKIVSVTQEASISQTKIEIPLLERRWIPLQTKLGESISWVLIILSLLGFFVFAIRYFTTRRKITALLKDSYLVRQHGRIQIVVSDQIVGPFSILMHRRNYIFMPNYMLADKKSFALSIKHEIQHHRQWDTRLVYLIEAIRCSLFYNPFAWLMTSQLSLLQELTCDEYLLDRKMVSPINYGRCLLQVAKYQSTISRRIRYIDLLGAASLSPSTLFLKRRLFAMKSIKYFSRVTSYLLGIVVFISFIGVGYASKHIASNTLTKGPELLNTSVDYDLYVSDAAYFPAKGKRAVVWVPGFIFNKESWFKMAKSLQAEGVASMAISGNSVNNVRSALQQLARRGHKDFILVGGSRGAKAILNMVDRVFTTSFVTGVVTMSAVGGNPIDDFNRSVPLRKLFIVSEKEKHMGTVQALYDESMEPKKLVVIPGKAHAQFLFYGPDKAKVEALIKNFILH
jgi:beta-lactamase regulating signal transducer with metallopeptidase domain